MEELDFQRGPWSAASLGDYDAIKSYVERGKDPSVKDSYGYTPLHYAARGGFLKIVELLLSSGADVMATTKASMSTPLHRAATTKHHNIVSLLLRHNADPCCQDIDGNTPLHIAVKNKRIENIKKILQHEPKCAEIKDNKSKVAKDYIQYDILVQFSNLFK